MASYFLKCDCWVHLHPCSNLHSSRPRPSDTDLPLLKGTCCANVLPALPAFLSRGHQHGSQTVWMSCHLVPEHPSALCPLENPRGSPHQLPRVSAASCATSLPPWAPMTLDTCHLACALFFSGACVSLMPHWVLPPPRSPLRCCSERGQASSCRPLPLPPSSAAFFF